MNGFHRVVSQNKVNIFKFIKSISFNLKNRVKQDDKYFINEPKTKFYLRKYESKPFQWKTLKRNECYTIEYQFQFKFVEIIYWENYENDQ